MSGPAGGLGAVEVSGNGPSRCDGTDGPACVEAEGVWRRAMRSRFESEETRPRDEEGTAWASS